MHHNAPVIVAVTTGVCPGVHDVAIIRVTLDSVHLVVLVVDVVGLVRGTGVDPGLGGAAASCHRIPSEFHKFSKFENIS